MILKLIAILLVIVIGCLFVFSMTKVASDCERDLEQTSIEDVFGSKENN